MGIGLLAALSPLGRDLLWSAFASGEQLSRNIAQPIVLWGAAALLVFVLAECLVRRRKLGARQSQ
jgi:hypothetical protein